MRIFKAVLFDLDNTLLDRTATFGTFAGLFVQTYLPRADAPEALIERIVELDRDGYKDKNELFAELLEELPWENRPEHGELLDFYSREYVKSAVLMEGADDVLAYMRGKYRTGLITNGRTAIQYGKIDRLGLRETFDAILVSEEAGVKKPDSRIFELALRRLGLRPEECLYVGDHPVNDVQGAADAGLAAIWLQVNQPWREGLTAKPLSTIRSLRELVALL